MKRLLQFFLYLPALMQTQKSFGQDSASKFAVVISPALFMPVSVAAQAGIQYSINKHCSFLAEVAYPTFYPKNDYEKISYWRSSATLKFYALKPQASRSYYAIQAAYLYRQLTDDNDGIVHRKDGEYRYDAATVNSPVLSVALIIGKELNGKGHKFFADIFTGAGIRHLFNKYTAKNLRLTSLDRPKDSFEWLFPEEGWRFDYPLTRFHVTAGLRLGWRL
jgi:hypothetical protein